MVEKLTQAGFNDYEISNFSKLSLESKHNSNYWKGNNYLGLGPSAHSYINSIRSWNVSDIKKYIELANSNGCFNEQEKLTPKDIFNEAIMLGLRTKKGVDLIRLKNDSNNEIMTHFNTELIKNIKDGKVFEQDGFLIVTKEKKFLTDKIISNFFIV